MRRIGTLIVFLLAAAPLAPAQTQVDLASQTKDVNFSSARAAKPLKTGATIAPVCSVGEVFFSTLALAEQSIATNTWTQTAGSGRGGGYGAGSASQLADFAASNSGAVETLGAGCSNATPCRIRIGPTVFTMTAPVALTISGTSAIGTVFWYMTSSQALVAGHNSAAMLTCSAGCTVVTGITSFPPDSFPLWQTTFTANIWDGINPATMDMRGVYSRDVIAVGTGMSSASNPSTGVQTLSTDPTVVPRYFAASGAPSMTCTPGRDFYTDTAGLHLYFCDAANVWKQADGGGSSRTDDQNFPLAGYSASSGGVALAAYTSVSVGTFAMTGPNGISYSVAGMPLGVSGSVMVTKPASPTWSGAAGTVDVSIVASNYDANPAAGNWNLNIYVGCAAVNGLFSYGTATTISAPPAGFHNFKLYSATGLNLPGSCAANSPLQFWVQRVADMGGTTGVNAFLVSIEVVTRGN